MLEQAIKALAMKPDLPDALAKIGVNFSTPDNLPRALAAFGRAARLDPTRADFAFAEGAALQAMGRTAEAEIHFANAAVRRWKEFGAPASAAKGRKALGLGWKPGNSSGWEVYGANIVKTLHRRGDTDCIVVDPVIAGRDQDEFRDSLARTAVLLETGKAFDFPVLAAMGNDFGRFPILGRGLRNIGVMFIEHTNMSAEGREDSRLYDLFIAGSAWCGEVLKSFGLTNVEIVIQGVDPELFHWRPRPLRGKTFRIFSGGKLEYRKGQDIVIETFRRFHARHPDAKLVVIWNSAVPQAAATIEWGGLIPTGPSIDATGRLDLARWLADLGLPEDAVEILGVVPNQTLPDLLAGVDAAIFTNRCEGGTNLPAMESMAMGVPTILSANTGHLDLIEPGNCLALTRQWRVHAPMVPGTEGWGESDIDEAIEALEQIYSDSDAAAAMGKRGAETLSRLSWDAQIAKLIEVIGI